MSSISNIYSIKFNEWYTVLGFCWWSR